MITRALRIPVNCPVRFTREDGESGEGIAYDLSTGGCVIEHAGVLAISEPMLLSLQLLLEPGASPITIELAQARWGTRREFGARFQLLPPQDRRRLAQFIRSTQTAPLPVGSA